MRYQTITNQTIKLSFSSTNYNHHHPSSSKHRYNSYRTTITVRAQELLQQQNVNKIQKRTEEELSIKDNKLNNLNLHDKINNKIKVNESISEISSLKPPNSTSRQNTKSIVSIPHKQKDFMPNSSSSQQFSETVYLVVLCVLGSSISAILLQLVPTLRAATNAMNEFASLAEALRDEIPDTLAAVRVSGLELTDALEEVGELTSEFTGVTKRTTRAIDQSLIAAQRVGGFMYEGSKTAMPRAKRQMKRTVKPIVRRTFEGVESIARERADLEPYSAEVISEVASTTKRGVGNVRKVIQSAEVAKNLTSIYKSMKGRSSSKGNVSEL